MLLLGRELANETSGQSVRTTAALIIKNNLKSKDYSRQEELAERWKRIDLPTKGEIKQLSLKALGASDGRAGSAAAQVVAAIAYIEVPRGEWEELTGILL